MAKKKPKLKKPIKKELNPQRDVQEIKATANKLAKDISSQLKLGESYISLVLGAVVVLGISVVLFLYVKESGLNGAPPVINDAQLPQIETPVSQTYTLQEGEGLWDVAVKFYGDGFRWTDIAKANGLEDNPDSIAPGMKLIIPNQK